MPPRTLTAPPGGSLFGHSTPANDEPQHITLEAYKGEVFRARLEDGQDDIARKLTDAFEANGMHAYLQAEFDGDWNDGGYLILLDENLDPAKAKEILAEHGWSNPVLNNHLDTFSTREEGQHQDTEQKRRDFEAATVKYGFKTEDKDPDGSNLRAVRYSDVRIEPSDDYSVIQHVDILPASHLVILRTDNDYGRKKCVEMLQREGIPAQEYPPPGINDHTSLRTVIINYHGAEPDRIRQVFSKGGAGFGLVPEEAIEVIATNTGLASGQGTSGAWTDLRPRHQLAGRVQGPLGA